MSKADAQDSQASDVPARPSPKAQARVTRKTACGAGGGLASIQSHSRAYATLRPGKRHQVMPFSVSGHPRSGGSAKERGDTRKSLKADASEAQWEKRTSKRQVKMHTSPARRPKPCCLWHSLKEAIHHLSVILA